MTAGSPESCCKCSGAGGRSASSQLLVGRVACAGGSSQGRQRGSPAVPAARQADLFPPSPRFALIVRTGTYLCVCFNAPIETSRCLLGLLFPSCCCHYFSRNSLQPRKGGFPSARASASPSHPHEDRSCQNLKSLLGMESHRGCRYMRLLLWIISLHAACFRGTDPSWSRQFTGELLT